MSERSFFNLRYALPGYTFILLNLLINLRIFLFFFLTRMPSIVPSNIATSLLGILFGFLTLLSGSAIGFLVSQCWYVFYDVLHYGSYRILRARFGPYKVLKDEFEVKDEIESLDTVYNYIVHSFPKEGIRSYLNRRWDLLMLFGSTSTAIVLGSGVACYIRQSIVEVPESQQTFVTWPIYDMLIIIVVAVLFIALTLSFIRILKEHHSMSTFVIRCTDKQLEEKCKRLRDELPEEYFQSD